MTWVPFVLSALACGTAAASVYLTARRLRFGLRREWLLVETLAAVNHVLDHSPPNEVMHDARIALMDGLETFGGEIQAQDALPLWRRPPPAGIAYDVQVGD